MKPKELAEHFDQVIQSYKGDIVQLEHAMGAYLVGRHFGWKVMLLIHDRKSIKIYEKILKLDFKESLPEVGEYAHKSNAWALVQKVSSFWKAVKGETPGVRTPMVK